MGIKIMIKMITIMIRMSQTPAGAFPWEAEKTPV